MNPAINEAIQAVNNIAPEIWKQAVNIKMLSGFILLFFAVVSFVVCLCADRDIKNSADEFDKVALRFLHLASLALSIVFAIMGALLALFPEYYAVKSIIENF